MSARDSSQKVSKTLKHFVLSRIYAGEYLPGDKIPAERSFVRMFGGGRATVRKALGELEKEGLVAREVGRGTFVKVPVKPLVHGQASMPGGVRSVVREHLLALGASFGPLDALELRLLIEPGVLERATARASEADIDAMQECLAAASTAATTEVFSHWDAVLYSTFAKATRNPLLENIDAMVGPAHALAVASWLRSEGPRGHRAMVHIAEHLRVVEAIRRRDAVEASRSVREHLTHLRAALLSSA